MCRAGSRAEGPASALEPGQGPATCPRAVHESQPKGSEGSHAWSRDAAWRLESRFRRWCESRKGERRTSPGMWREQTVEASMRRQKGPSFVTVPCSCLPTGSFCCPDVRPESRYSNEESRGN